MKHLERTVIQDGFNFNDLADFGLPPEFQRGKTQECDSKVFLETGRCVGRNFGFPSGPRPFPTINNKITTKDSALASDVVQTNANTRDFTNNNSLLPLAIIAGLFLL